MTAPRPAGVDGETSGPNFCHPSDNDRCPDDCASHGRRTVTSSDPRPDPVGGDEVRRLRELCEQVTPGPWHAAHGGQCCSGPCIVNIHSNGLHDVDCSYADQRFIAAARTALPELLDAVERLTGERDALRVANEKLLAVNLDMEGQANQANEALTLVTSGWMPLPYRENERLTREVEALREALLEQWEANHAEHCSREWPHPEGRRCHWPRPAALGEEGDRRPCRGRNVNVCVAEGCYGQACNGVSE